jgi:cyclophilin family peptidyl-prolyl cis-trans isomerase
VKNLLLAIVSAAFLAGGFKARAQEVINTNHTVVRFEVFNAGLSFGSIDIELFDQEKPETVRNFLRYIYRGVYSNLVLHRLVPNFVLQAGHVTIANPASIDAFTGYSLGANFGTITNEYSVGPELSNAFGTIAMARVPGSTNSASANWFINLTNNLSLDSVDGGFTVFGRVVNTSGDRTGTNLLQFFNGVPVAQAFMTDTFEFLTELPVSGTPQGAPRYTDLFTVRASIISGPHVPAPQHSVVRFNIFTGGANFGTLDIELFDQEKPETVKNFLLYVYSSVYSNLVLHEIAPNDALQAGRVRLEGLSGNDVFNRYTPGVNWGRITNEYSVGPELRNDFGTIAMARVFGETNSASSEFFFNLTNSVFLNTNNGGFTVFGRVINSFDDRSGTNLLNFFNSLSTTNGIKGVFIPEFFEFLPSLPVSVIRPTTLVSDLFVAQAYVLQGVTTRDTNAPVAAITEPPLDPPVVLRTTNSVFDFSGTAGDNDGVARVFVEVREKIDGPFSRSTADGKNQWASEVQLKPGTNFIAVRSLDYFGNLSLPEERVVFYSVARPVTLQVQGKGKVAGITDGQMMEVGVTYPLTATPAKGQYFTGWRGSVLNTNARTAYFTMQEDALVIVRFSKTLLGLATGKYEGVFSPPTNGLRNSTGLISLSLKPNGFYTGRLKPLGANYFIRGKFDANGQSIIFGPLGTNLLVLSMALLGEGSEGIVGAYSDGHFESGFTLWRAQSYGRTNSSSYAGQYSFLLSPPGATNNDVTDGSGFGTATVDSRGRIKWSGVLADGAVVKGTAVELAGGRWPFHYTKRNGDSLAGFALFSTNGTFAGSDVRWFAPGFPGETNQKVRLDGSLYTPPSQARLFDWTNGVLTLSGDGLMTPITSDVILHEDGSFQLLSNTNNIEVFVTDGTGLINGSFTHPISGLTTPLQGAVLQSSNKAAGFFPGTPGGNFQIRRAP